MAHEIQADSTTYVGYDVLNDRFYVKNLDTQIIANTVDDIKSVLDITSPSNTITVEEIEVLSTALEDITGIYYTWEDTGKYIKTIYFNEYSEHAMQYDEPSLYIQGTSELWDMSSTINADVISEFMWQYYTYHLHLNVPMALMDSIVNYFVTLQSPYVYNVIATQTDDEKEAGDPLEFTNEMIMNNHNSKSNVEYTGTLNPDNVSTLNTYSITTAGYVTTTDTAENSLTCDVEPECEIGDILQVIGKTIHYDNLVVKRVEGNKIYVEDTTTIEKLLLGNDEEAKVYIRAYGITRSGYEESVDIKSAQTINEITSDKIYLSDVLTDDMYVVGDTVWVNYGDDMLESYTITAITPTTYDTSGLIDGYITVDGTPTEYKYRLGADVIYLEIRSDVRTAENSMVLTYALPLAAGDTFEVVNSTDLAGTYTVESIDDLKVYVNMSGTLPEVDFAEGNKGIVQLPVDSKRMELDITYSKYPTKVPAGTFLLDNKDQFTQYLQFYNVVTPSNQNYNYMNQQVPTKYYLGDDLLTEGESTYMTCIGIYSDIYESEESE